LAGSAGLVGAAAAASGLAILLRTRRRRGPPAIQASIRQDWLDRRKEAIIEPELPIIDPHHHLWDRPYRYLFQDLRADVGSGHKIVATLFAECGAMYRTDGPVELKSLGETEFVTGVARRGASGEYGSTRYIAGIIGYVDLRTGSRAKGVLEQHMAVSDGRLRSIRNGSASHADPSLRIYAGAPPGLLLERDFREGFAALAPLGLGFDVWVIQTQLKEVVNLARDFPQTTIVLDHLGGPLAVGPYAGKREEAFTEWREGIYEVASCPNVFIKLGGLGMKLIGFAFYESDLPPSSHDLEKAWRPYIETCIEAFGPQRSMYESNFPVDKGTCSYQVLWNAFKRIAAGCSADEKTGLFSGAASKAYQPMQF
jgi:predicted TIM-barrel fold metal-dependent hydrolase